MALSAFGDKSKKPTDSELTRALGRTRKLWDKHTTQLTDECGPISQEWKFYGRKAGWTLQLKSSKRTILYLIPCHGHFRAVFVYGESAVEAAHKSRLPANILSLIDSARPYVEGRSFHVEVRNAKDLGYVRKLVTIKMEA